MTIGEKLKARRKELKLTQEDAAQQLHVSRQAISNWELGKNYPDLDTVIVISEVYKLSLDDLLKGDRVIVKKIKTNMYMTVIMKGLILLALLALSICLVVDFVLNHRFTWSLIILISLASIGIVWLTIQKSRTHKLISGSLCLSIVAILYLFLLEKILLISGFVQNPYFIKVALPVSLIWLCILWVAAFIQWIVKWHKLFTFALIFIAAIFANYLTGVIIGDTRNTLRLIISLIANGSVAIFCIILGNYITRSKIISK